MLRACKYCGKIHQSTVDCGKKPVSFFKRKESEKGRYTNKWRKKSEEIKSRSKYLCAVCLSRGTLTYSNLETHHIIKLSEQPELLLEDENLICLCCTCHREAERGEINKNYLKKLVNMRENIPPTHEKAKK